MKTTFSSLLSFIILMLAFNYSHAQVLDTTRHDVNSQLQLLEQQAKRLDEKIDSSRNALGEPDAPVKRKKGLLNGIKHKGASRFATSNRDLVTTNWLSGYALGGMVTNQGFQTFGSGFGLMLSHMSLKPFSFSGFGEAIFYPGDNREGRLDYLEKKVDVGVMTNFYPHVLWGGMPRNVFNTSVGISGGLRFIDKRYYHNPIDRLLSVRWGAELTRPVGSDKAFTGNGTVSFISMGVTISSPIVKFGQSGTVNVHLKLSGNPFGKKKIIASYFHRI